MSLSVIDKFATIVAGQEVLNVEYQLGEGDYRREKCVKDAVGLKGCLPYPWQSEGATLAIILGAKTVLVTFGRYTDPSEIKIIPDGGVVSSVEGPAARDFALACDNAKKPESGKGAPVANVFAALRNI